MRKQITVLLCLAAVLACPPAGRAQKSRKITVKFTWEIANAKATEAVWINTVIPSDIPGRQKVNSVRFSEAPSRNVTIGNDHHIGFKFESPDIPREVVIYMDMEIYKSGMRTQKSRPNAVSDADAGKYLGSTKFITPEDPAVKAIADSLRKKTDKATLKNIFAYVSETLTYDQNQKLNQGCATTLQKKSGSSSDYCDLMAALCRANRIPARICGGHWINEDLIPGWDKNTAFFWLEAYIEGYGWIPFDPTFTEPNEWDVTQPRYICISRDVGNQEHSDHQWYGWETVSWDGWRPRIDSYYSVK